MHRGLIITLLVGLLMTPALTQAAGKTLTIGISATYTGFAAGTGSVSDGEIDYLKWLASRGGIEYKDPKTGKMERVGLKILWEDNQYNVAKSVAIYKRFRARGANLITGIGSTPGEACAPSASRNKLPYLSWYAYASPAGHKPKPQYYWTCAATICEAITPMIKWVIKDKLKGVEKPRIGIMAMNVPSWRVLAKPGLMDLYIKKLGGELAGIEFMPPLTTDLSLPITRLIKDKKADAIVHVGVISHTVVLAKDLQRLGIDTKKIPIVCNLSSWDETLFKSIPEEMEGMYGEALTVLPEEDTPGVKKAKMVARWAGRKPGAVNLNYLSGLVGSMLIEEAFKRVLAKAGYEAVARSGQLLRDELQTFKEFDTGGIAPSVGVMHTVEPFFLNKAHVIQARGGKFHKVSDWYTVDIIEGAIK